MFDIARYFFDLIDGEMVVEDRVGMDLASLALAREEAIVLAADVVGQRATQAMSYDARELCIRAASGGYLAKVALRYVSA